ncbi:phage tail protein [uncultured Sphingomonas sp.]|uniref:phage tail protein n=1 Tax=uncultured Sphingomonas sp. TaxID=158754 RepID=UPI0025F882D8|nr:phage tail protein [uncultured Sphingomonas sp.]
MKKLDALRALLVRAVPALAADPSRLAIFVDRGRVGARTGNLSFEYRYSVNLVLLDYAGDQDAVIVPIIAWIAEHQPELLQRQDSEPFGFESEWLAQDKQDLSITIDLTERVAVQRVAGGITTEHLADTLPPDIFPGAEGARLWQGLAEDLAAGETTIVAPR